MRLVVLVALLAGCADNPSFVYTVELPRHLDASSPVFTIEGHEGETIVDVVFDSYEQALDEFSLNVTLEHQGATTSRPLELKCSSMTGGNGLGRLVSERVRLEASGSPPSILIDTYTCSGPQRSFALVDCGC